MEKKFLLFVLVGIGIGWFFANSQIDDKALVKYPYPFLFSNQEEETGNVIAQGHWELVGEEAVNKYNTVQVTCHGPYTFLNEEGARKLGLDRYKDATCDIIQADVFNGLLAVDETSFEVTSWGKDKIISESGGICVSTTMIVDKASETVTQTSTYISDNKDFCLPKGTPPKQVILK